MDVTNDESVDVDISVQDDDAPVQVDNPSWELAGICRIDQEGEMMFDAGNSGVIYREIAGAQSLDPPKRMPPDQPVRKTKEKSISSY